MNDEPEYDGPVSLPGEPTDALPGSEIKIRILTERAARREQLFHPLDGMSRKTHPGRPDRLVRNHWPAPEPARLLLEPAVSPDLEVDEWDEPAPPPDAPPA